MASHVADRRDDFATDDPGLAAVTALLLGTAVAGIYRWARRGESLPPTFVPTLVLLSVLIAMATQVIGDSVARAFSLVGALSVVRFRTVVKDSQDTAFVLFAVVVGMAAGANNLVVALIGFGIIGVAALILWPKPRPAIAWVADGTLCVRLGLIKDPEAIFGDVLAEHLEQHDLLSVATAKKGQVLELIYLVHLRPDGSPTALVAALQLREGVISVDLRRSNLGSEW